MRNERNHRIGYAATAYEAHTLKNENKIKSFEDIFVYHFFFYICLFVAANLL